MKTESPLVSVIVITYNQSGYVADTLQGILNQEISFPLELIISNDHSTDESDAVINSIINQYSGDIIIKFTSQPVNLGIINNLIFCLDECTGKYIAVCEGDDYWIDKLKLEKQVSCIENNPACSMVISNRKVISTNKTPTNELYNETHGKHIFSIHDVVQGFVPGTQTMLFKNHDGLAVFLRAHPGIYYGDRYIAYFCSLFGNIHLIEDVTAVYRQTGDGVWSTNNPIEKLFHFTHFMEDFHQSLGIPINNSVLAERWLSASYITFRYCLKRPRLFRDPTYTTFVKEGWKKLNQMNRIKILLAIIFKNG